ncbi:hypothetical protein D3C87_1999140 [compost metagenome]
MLDGFTAAAADGRWQGDAASEARRRSLLPGDEALDWQALTASSRYAQAQRLLAGAQSRKGRTGN